MTNTRRMIDSWIWLLALLHVFAAWRLRCDLRGPVILAAMVTLQAVLGIVTLLYEAPLALSLAHQALAIVLFTYAVAHAERLSQRANYTLAQAAEQGA